MSELFFFLIVIRTKNNNFFNASPLSNDLIKVVYSLMITCSFQARTKRITHDVINTHTHVYTNEKMKFYLIVDIIVIYVVLYIRTRDESRLFIYLFVKCFTYGLLRFVRNTMLLFDKIFIKQLFSYRHGGKRIVKPVV